jgi:hypothetical protein
VALRRQRQMCIRDRDKVIWAKTVSEKQSERINRDIFMVQEDKRKKSGLILFSFSCIDWLI